MIVRQKSLLAMAVTVMTALTRVQLDSKEQRMGSLTYRRDAGRESFSPSPVRSYTLQTQPTVYSSELPKSTRSSRM